MAAESLKTKTVSGIIWRFTERFLAQIVSTVVGIVLARLLIPEDYGLIAIIMIFIDLCSVITTQGFSAALIQKKDADDTDFSTIFFLSIALSAVLYAILFIIAPFISEFYELPILSSLLRTMGLILPFSAITSVQRAIISRNFAFKKALWATLISTSVAAVVGIYMAYAGFGPWALCGQYLINAVIGSVALTFFLKWNPKPIFSLKRAVSMFSFGWKLLAASLLEILNIDMQSFFIGKYYSSADLAQYNRGKQFPQLLSTNINDSIGTVLFSTFSVQKDNHLQLVNGLKRAIKLSTFIIFPCQVGLAVIAEPLTLVLLTEKWLPSVPYMQIICFCYCFTPIFTTNAQVLKALGEGNLYLISCFISNVCSLLIMLFALQFGVIYVAIGGILSTLIMTLAYCVLCGKRIKYGTLLQLRDLIPNISNVLVMAVCTWGVGYLIQYPLLKLLIQIIVGVITYVVTAFIIRNESMRYCLDLFKSLLNKGKE